ncbi:MAG: dienelactone hydrolase family protein [Telmatospirillum sp.]|nr:dienelactone hydrolase family protein [Telmatospirillum sp.]
MLKSRSCGLRHMAAIVFLTVALGACARTGEMPPNLLPLGDFVAVLHPGGTAPRATAVLVPGCEGVGSHIDDAARRLAEAGVIAIVFDYPRRQSLDPACRMLDLAALRRDLVAVVALTLREVNVVPDRLHLIGWGQGGSAVMAVLADVAPRIRSAAAFYPDCTRLERWQVPVPMLLLLGDADRIAPPEICARLAEAATGGENVLAIRYGGAGHGFDAPTEMAAPAATAFWRSPRAAPRAAYAPHVRDAAWADLRAFFDLPQDASGL